jgi:hypothetical protein
MTTSARVSQLLSKALDEFDTPGTSLAAHVRRAARIAALRQDYGNQYWLQLQMSDVTVTRTQDPAVAKIREQLDSLLGAEAGGQEALKGYLIFERSRSALVDGQIKLYMTPVGALEQQLQTTQAAHDDFLVPGGLSGGDLYYAQQHADGGRAQLIPIIGMLQGVLDRVRTAVHEFLVSTEAELERGQARAGLFERAQEYVNASLEQYAPSALSQFVAAQERLYSGTSEDLAHALTSCRRMIKSLADHLYPASNDAIVGADGVTRKMSDDQYRNRLLEYVRQTLGKHGQGEVMQRTLDSLGARLKSLDALASKGVHDEVSAAEAETCVVWTYLLAADLLRLADGTSALLVDVKSAAI